MTFMNPQKQCPVCFEPLPNKDAICQGRLPGALGKVEFSEGPCLSNRGQREELEARRREAAEAARRSP